MTSYGAASFPERPLHVLLGNTGVTSVTNKVQGINFCVAGKA